MIGKSVCDKKLCNLQSAQNLCDFCYGFVFFRILSCVNHSCETKQNGTDSKYIYFNLFFSTKKTNFFPDAIKTFIFSHQQKRGSIVLKTEWKTNESNLSRQRAEKRITVHVLVLRAGGKSISHIGFRMVRSPYFSYFILYVSFFCQNDFFLLWIFFNEQFCFVVVFFESCWVCLVLLVLDLV